jgi:hypothetical protein
MTSSGMNEAADSIREKVRSGLSVDEAIRLLHQNEFTITQSMKFLVDEYRISLSEAKNLVSNHPIWQVVVEASEPLKDELINSIKGKFGSMSDSNED